MSKQSIDQSMSPDNYSELLDDAYSISVTANKHLKEICKCIKEHLHKHSHKTIEEALAMKKFIDVLNYLYDTQDILKEIRYESICFANDCKIIDLLR